VQVYFVWTEKNHEDFQFTLTVAAVSLVAILSACGSSGSSSGGSGSGSSGGGSGTGSTASFYDKLADGDRLARRLDQLDLTPQQNCIA
jgi:hypothetical protein